MAGLKPALSTTARGLLSQSMPVIATAVLAASSYWLAWTSGLLAFSNAPKGSIHSTDYYAEHFTWLRVTQDGRKRAQLTGPRADHIPFDDQLVVQQPRYAGAHADGSALEAHSESARFNNLTGLLDMQGNVQLQRTPTQGESVLIQTQAMTINTDLQTATTNAPAHMVRGQSTMDGNTVFIDNLNGQLQAQGKVRVYIEPRKAP